MIDREQFLSIAAILRRAANRSYQGDLRVLLRGIERAAGERLHDLTPPDPDDVVDYFIACHNGRVHTECWTTRPGGAWDFFALMGSNGICRLTILLRPHYRKALRKAASRQDKQYLRWYPAAEVLLYCAYVRRDGPRADLVEALIDRLATMTSLEESIGAKLRQANNPRGPNERTKGILRRMASRMTANKRLSQEHAAELTFEKDGLGTSAAANVQAWKRWARKLGHQA